MAQEITIIVVIDTMAALQAGRLEGNIYLIDNLKGEGSEGNGTGHLVTAINGTYWLDGSQASEPLLNWLVAGVGSLPPSLPRTFHARQSRLSDVRMLEAVETAMERGQRGRGLETSGPVVHEANLVAIAEAAKHRGHRSRVSGKHPGTGEPGLKLLNLTGEIFQRHEGDTYASQLAPILINVTGEAVDEGIIYPAQYGTPVPVNDGWYWSATASTYKAGVFAYTMRFKLYELCWHDGEAVWEPREMSYDARIRVGQRAMVNGFTGAGVGLLPMADREGRKCD